MIKFFFIVIPMMLFIASPFFSNEEKVRITQEVNPAILPGETFLVTLKVFKSDITGFARLQQYLPEGFTAEEVESHGADFIFEDGSAKFNWINLPSEEEFAVTYRVKTATNISGKKTMTGVFVYIDEEKTRRKELEQVTIQVNDQSRSASAVPEIRRQIILLNKEKGEYRVELTFEPNGLKESAQFTDEIPEGYRTVIIDAHGSQVNVAENKAVFNWTAFPGERQFVVSYLVTNPESTSQPVINGTLVYGGSGDLSENKIQIESTPVRTDQAFAESAEETKPEPEKQEAALSADYIPVTSKGITFRVQISATRNSTPKTTSWFNQRYQIDNDVELTEHEGWKKYLIGNFDGYNQAKAFRVQTSQKVSDAFVVAYQNGVRIPVQEAIRNKSMNQ